MIFGNKNTQIENYISDQMDSATKNNRFLGKYNSSTPGQMGYVSAVSTCIHFSFDCLVLVLCFYRLRLETMCT